MHTHTTRIRVHDADAAGVLFFGRYFTLAHDVFEAFLEDVGVGLAHQVLKGDFIVTVVHAESDYRLPLWVGEEVTVTFRVEEIRRKIFTLAYEIANHEGKRSCTLQTKHMVVDKKTGRAIPLPEVLVEALRTQTSP